MEWFFRKDIAMLHVPQSGRLAYHQQKPDAEFWDHHWQEQDIVKLYEETQAWMDSFFGDTFERFFSKQTPMLEAGCGLGQIVHALRAQGYACEGVEWAEKTVTLVQKQFPDLPIRAGDVTALDCPDETYGAYISLGVIEHRQDGPEPFLKEAFRVLRPGGTALFSVPYYNPLRRLKARLGCYDRSAGETPFYQYAYDQTTLASMFTDHGFEIIDIRFADPVKGLRDESRILRALFKVPHIGWRLRQWSSSSSCLARMAGHMILFICRKKE